MCDQCVLWVGGVSIRVALKAPSARKERRFECADSKQGLSQSLAGVLLGVAKFR